MAKKKQKTILSKSIIQSKWWLAGVIVVLVILANIVSGGRILSVTGILIPAPTSTPTPTAKPKLPAEIISPEAGLLSKESYIELAKKDLADKLKIGMELITVVKIESKDWSDTSLGCPKKNYLYAQVITPGYLITISVSGKIYGYHAGLNKIVTCSSDS